MQAHSGAEAVQITAVGGRSEGLSRVPARTPIKSGRAELAVVTGVPQAGQKLRTIWLPETADDSKRARAPVKPMSAVRNMAFTVAEPEARYWQTRHQQARTRTG